MNRSVFRCVLYVVCGLLMGACDSGSINVLPESVDDEQNPDGGKNSGNDTPEPEKKDCEGIDLQTSDENCGQCGHACLMNAGCAGGECACKEGFFDCNRDGACESSEPCECMLGDEKSCYQGPTGTEGVGNCKPGVMKCIADDDGSTYWELTCEGSVLPDHHIVCNPANPEQDMDCNGIPDMSQDMDKDGYAVCSETGEQLDCCDNTIVCSVDKPELIHPGNSVDCFGNNVDDDCDGEVDEDKNVDCFAPVVDKSCLIAERSCSAETDYNHPASSGVTHIESMVFSTMYLDSSNTQPGDALALSKAMDMCMPVVAEADNMAGIIEYSITGDALGSKPVGGRQINVKTGMYDGAGQMRIAPRVGGTFALLSTGDAQDVKGGVDDKKNIAIREYLNNYGSLPASYLRIHPNGPVLNSKCESSGNTTYYDMAHLHLKLRAPETAHGFSIDFRFFSKEYPYFVCSGHNDAFLMLLTDAAGNPIIDTNGNGDMNDEDGNIAFDKQGSLISVNSAFFTTCNATPCGYPFMSTFNVEADGCPKSMSCGADSRCGVCSDGPDDLYGLYTTPYDGSGVYNNEGGGTGWLTTQAPIAPGSVFNLDFYTWDDGDQQKDSTVILDNFQWICGESTLQTDFAKPVEVVN